MRAETGSNIPLMGVPMQTWVSSLEQTLERTREDEAPWVWRKPEREAEGLSTATSTRAQVRMGRVAQLT